jgi:hypothetical protein
MALTSCWAHSPRFMNIHAISCWCFRARTRSSLSMVTSPTVKGAQPVGPDSIRLGGVGGKPQRPRGRTANICRLRSSLLLAQEADGLFSLNCDCLIFRPLPGHNSTQICTGSLMRPEVGHGEVRAHAVRVLTWCRPLLTVSHVELFSLLSCFASFTRVKPSCTGWLKAESYRGLRYG